RVRRVEHVEAFGAERPAQHFRREARAAHAEQDERVDLAGRGDVLGELLELAQPFADPPRLVEPAEPLGLVAARPERRVPLPDPLDDAVLAHAASARNGSTSASNSRGRSMLGACAVAGMVAWRAPGISRASRSTIASMSGWSSSPTSTSVGTSI